MAVATIVGMAFALLAVAVVLLHFGQKRLRSSSSTFRQISWSTFSLANNPSKVAR
jgi:uncharacterized membrane protein